MTFDAVVLAGGSGRRLAGPSKPRTTVGSRSMLGAVLAASSGAVRTVVVGPGYDVVESPPGGGPVAAVAAGLPLVTAPTVVVLAADLPFLTRAAVDALVAAAPAVAVDDDGHEQWLCGAWPTAALRAAVPADPSGAGFARTVERLAPQRLSLAGFPPPWWDCDTPAQLEQARSWA